MMLFRRDYVESLFDALLTVGALLAALGWAWNPHAGFSGIGGLFSRYLLSIGMPVEQWLHTLADLAQRQDDPQAFMDAACDEMVRQLPWIKGGDWSDGKAQGKFGERSGRRTEFRQGPLTIGINTAQPLSPSLIWHFNLLAQLLGEFYGDKVRSRQLKQRGYVQAIHETGARLTHDVKNLLQSLNVLCAAAEAETDRPSPALAALLRRQLPTITQRLAQTLEKLQAPRRLDGSNLDADQWLETIRVRYADAGVECALMPAAAGLVVPVQLFSSAAENLLQNAIDKRRVEQGIAIRLTLDGENGLPALEVADSGTPIAMPLARQLLHEPVASENGLGIGLYQLARQADLAGYRLALAENRSGCVRFRLSRVP